MNPGSSIPNHISSRVHLLLKSWRIFRISMACLSLCDLCGIETKFMCIFLLGFSFHFSCSPSPSHPPSLSNCFSNFPFSYSLVSIIISFLVQLALLLCFVSFVLDVFFIFFGHFRPKFGFVFVCCHAFLTLHLGIEARIGNRNRSGNGYRNGPPAKKETTEKRMDSGGGGGVHKIWHVHLCFVCVQIWNEKCQKATTELSKQTIKADYETYKHKLNGWAFIKKMKKILFKELLYR